MLWLGNILIYKLLHSYSNDLFKNIIWNKIALTCIYLLIKIHNFIGKLEKKNIFLSEHTYSFLYVVIPLYLQENGSRIPLGILKSMDA